MANSSPSQTYGTVPTWMALKVRHLLGSLTLAAHPTAQLRQLIRQLNFGSSSSSARLQQLFIILSTSNHSPILFTITLHLYSHVTFTLNMYIHV
jgi:hypothetical protein